VLERLLERLPEPIAGQTLELIEMLHPASGDDDQAATVIDVEFGKHEPPRAA
jgi:hypothetical protein